SLFAVAEEGHLRALWLRRSTAGPRSQCTVAWVSSSSLVVRSNNSFRLTHGKPALLKPPSLRSWRLRELLRCRLLQVPSRISACCLVGLFSDTTHSLLSFKAISF